MKRIAFYTRISTDEDHQKYSLDAQRDRLESYARAQYGEEWTLFKVYRDQDSGTHMRRTGLVEMLADAKAHSFDVLLVYRVDRLSRKLRQLAQMIDDMTEWGVALKSITEPFDSGNLAGMMMLQMLGVFAQFEHGTIVERTKVGMEKKARTGLWVGGPIPYGYRLDPELKALVPCEDEAVVVRKIFTTYAVGREGVGSLCAQLTAMGHRKRSGKPWDRRTLLHMLRNPIYAGKIRWRTALHVGTHAAIVPEELFDRASAVLQERSDDLKGRQWNNGSERLLTGITYCARCGGGMVGVSTRRNGKKINYYACLTRERVKRCDQDYMRADALEALVIRDVKTLLRDDAFVDRVWAETNRRLEEQRPDIDQELVVVTAEVVRVQERIDRYVEAFEAGSLDATAFGANVQALRDQLRQLEATRGDLEAQAVNLRLPALDRAHILALLDNFEEVFESGTNPQRKHLLHQMVKEVRVHGRTSVEITYFVPQPDPGGSPVRTQPQMAPHIGLERPPDDGPGAVSIFDQQAAVACGVEWVSGSRHRVPSPLNVPRAGYGDVSRL